MVYGLEEVPVNNGILEGWNSIVQTARSGAKGFHKVKYYKTIVHLTTGKLNFQKINPCVGSIYG
jgi:hypothetical protein